jgi:hypothetical protein
MLRPVVPIRKQGSEGRFERLRAEPLPLQLGCGLRRLPEPRSERPRPFGLGVDRVESGVGRLRRDAVRFEVVADRLVAVAALGERRRPRGREAAVVDVADALERLERVGTCRLFDPRLGEPLVDLPARAVAMPERLRGDVQRVRTRSRGRRSRPLRSPSGSVEPTPLIRR